MKRMLRDAILIFAMISAILFRSGNPVSAQLPGGRGTVTVNTQASTPGVKRGQSGKLVIAVTIPAGFHINAAKPDDPDLIATEFDPSTITGVKFSPVYYPKPIKIKTPGSDKPLLVYEGTVVVIAPYKIAPTAATGKIKIGGKLTYQACDANACFPPKTADVLTTVAVK